MPLSSPFPKRKSPRAKWIDYNSGYYFITVCTKDKKHYFGSIRDKKMSLSVIGAYLDNILSTLNPRFPEITISDYVVMPNHIHAMVFIDWTMGRNPYRGGQSLLSVFIGGIKSAVTRFANRGGLPFAWQTRYHDHMIRNQFESDRIAKYIQDNVEVWDSDIFND